MAQEYPLFANQYRLVRRVAAGGMGEVYLAIDEGPRGPRQVAIKRMLPGATETDAIFTSFMDELRLAPRLNHANIVRVLNHGQAEDMHFMAMEYIDGRNLFELVSRAVKTGRSIDFSAALQIVHDVAAGAHYAHTLTDESGAPLGVVHRDLNPRNIMVTTDGVTKLLDFGVAKAATQANETLPGVVKGTPSYLAPEQLAGTPATLRTDIFAMGILLWELTTVRRLFRRASMMESMRAVLACEVPAPSSLVPDYPAVIEPIALRALARRPADRYASAMEMRLDIIKALAQLRPTGEAREQVAALVRDLNEPSMPVEIGPPEEPTMAEQTAAVSVSVSALSVDPAAERGNLPPEDGRLIGRARELKQLASLLDKRPIVSLYGPPGGGKTRLALELGRDRLASGTTGVYLCELESAQTRGDVCAVVGSAMRLSLDASDESVIDVFAEALAERGETLVILDGIEHVAEAVWDVVASWSAAAPQARFIVTCRQRMKRKGATSMEVEPLSLEASGDAAWSPAVELFIDRARLKVPDFAPKPKQLAEIRRITRHLDGIPLAIQL
ncbi:MAG: serine/threonine protein kinase, partial [Myxococcota bacterium]